MGQTYEAFARCQNGHTDLQTCCFHAQTEIGSQLNSVPNWIQKWSCNCLRSDEPDRASWSLQHLGSQLRYGRLVSPATWKDELVGPGRILGSSQSDPSVSSFQRFVSAPGRFEEQVPRNVMVAPDELGQTSAKSMDVWLLGWQNSSLLYSIQQNTANLLWIFFNPITGDILIHLTGLHKKRLDTWQKRLKRDFSEVFTDVARGKCNWKCKLHSNSRLQHLETSFNAVQHHCAAQPLNLRTIGPPVSSDVPYAPGRSTRPDANHNLCMLYSVLMTRKTL